MPGRECEDSKATVGDKIQITCSLSKRLLSPCVWWGPRGQEWVVKAGVLAQEDLSQVFSEMLSVCGSTSTQGQFVASISGLPSLSSPAPRATVSQAVSYPRQPRSPYNP